MSWLCRLAAACAGGRGPRLAQPRGNAERSGQRPLRRRALQSCSAWSERSVAERSRVRHHTYTVSRAHALPLRPISYGRALSVLSLPPAVSRMWQCPVSRDPSSPSRPLSSFNRSIMISIMIDNGGRSESAFFESSRATGALSGTAHTRHRPPHTRDTPDPAPRRARTPEMGYSVRKYYRGFVM